MSMCIFDCDRLICVKSWSTGFKLKYVKAEHIISWNVTQPQLESE